MLYLSEFQKKEIDRRCRLGAGSAKPYKDEARSAVEVEVLREALSIFPQTQSIISEWPLLFGALKQ